MWIERLKPPARLVSVLALLTIALTGCQLNTHYNSPNAYSSHDYQSHRDFGHGFQRHRGNHYQFRYRFR